MGIIDRASVQTPELHREVVSCPSLGGDVVVQGLLLSQYLALQSLRARLADTPATATADEKAQAQEQAGATLVAHTLHLSVLASDDKPLYSADEWQKFGCRHLHTALLLFSICSRLSGYDLEQERKNS